MAIAHGLPLGAGPRPSCGDEFATRLRASATASLAGAPISGLDTATISARLDGADIEALDLDLTGVAIELPSSTDDSGDRSAPLEPSPEVSRERGHLRAARITARPAMLAGAPVDLEVNVSKLRIAWISRADGTTELDASDDDLGRMDGTARLAIAHEHLPAVATAVLNSALASAGASVSDVAIAITGEGEDAASLDATAKARYGVMSAGVRLRASLRIVDGRRLRLDGLDLSTKNLLAGALLGLARGELEKLDGQEFDLVELLPADVRNPQVHLEVTPTGVAVTASFG